MNDIVFITIIEDDKVIRESLSLLINSETGFKCISTYESVEDALVNLNEELPDVILMDITLPGMTGIDGTKIISESNPDIDVIMLTVHSDEDNIFNSLCAGACGYLMKNSSPENIISAIREVHEGGAPMSTSIARKIATSFRIEKQESLTARETAVLISLCKGNTYKQIANELEVSQVTVHFHIKNIYKKLSVHSKSEAVAKAIKNKIV